MVILLNAISTLLESSCGLVLPVLKSSLSSLGSRDENEIPYGTWADIFLADRHVFFSSFFICLGHCPFVLLSTQNYFYDV